jgi:hypothetical protein
MMLITMLQSFIRICLYSKYVIYLESIDFQDSFQGLLRCYSGIVTVPGFFSGIITVPGLFSGIITLLFRDYYCTWILFRDCYCPPHLFWGLLLYSFSTLLLYSFSTLLLSSISGIIQATLFKAWFHSLTQYLKFSSAFSLAGTVISQVYLVVGFSPWWSLWCSVFSLKSGVDSSR